ncbi:hypothetical protein COS70_04905 [Candidatus Micrarchaeota archaeon CG06_land_8_20_14_3_00_50_6]|nr:MAG: hypothetical protein COS70_04905 [Candidatus Micrarchaeota archaeon CG06_land_8_20_14_3_00_50_6]
MNPPIGLCVRCKGTKLLCGNTYCPILKRINFESSLKQRQSNTKVIFSKTPPDFFVGSRFPDAGAGPLVSLVDENDLPLADNPSLWYGLPYEKIIALRSNVIRGFEKINLRQQVQPTSRFHELQVSQLSQTPFDMELAFKKLNFSMKFSSHLQPMGGSGALERFTICENPEIPAKAEKIVGDELKATGMIGELSANGFDNYYITKLLTSGLLGMKKRFVPTRWAITATDSQLSKQFIAKIKTHPSINEIHAGVSEYLSNKFIAIFLPGAFEFENFEAWAPKTLWSSSAERFTITEEYEGFYGRSDYAGKQAGGYYASKFAIAEHLNKIRKQARVVVIREVYEGYQVPVGVWQVRENVREAVKGMKKLGSFVELQQFISSKMRVPFAKYLRESKILPQKKLVDF